MVDIEKEQKIWKPYPKYPWIEANQLGEIRMKDHYVKCENGSKQLISGRVLKQYLYPNGYMFVRFSLNGKRITLLVHRIVATCFLPNPNNLPVVNHKDNNRTNNSVSNLEWCTKEYNEAYKKNFGTSQAQLFGCTVFAVNLETGKVLRFKSQSEAGRQLGIDNSHINAVVKGRELTAGGYLFVDNENEITKEKIREIKAKMQFRGGVIAVNSENGEVFWFESKSEAARQLCVDQSAITKVVKGHYNKTRDYWFCNSDESAVEKTRAKFGDDVAKKVEKLISEIYKTF